MPIFRENPKLLSHFRNGDKAALEQVYRHYAKLVAYIVRKSASVYAAKPIYQMPYDEIHDLIQEVFIRAFSEKNRLSFDGIREYRPFLVTICKNLVIDFFRKPLKEFPSSHIDFDAIAKEADYIKSDKEAWNDPHTMKIVENYIRDLPPLLKNVHEERYVKCIPQTQASKNLGLTRQNIRTLETQLRNGLRNLLEELDK